MTTLFRILLEEDRRTANTSGLDRCRNRAMRPVPAMRADRARHRQGQALRVPAAALTSSARGGGKFRRVGTGLQVEQKDMGFPQETIVKLL